MMKKKDRQRLKEEELKKQDEVKQEVKSPESNYQDQYIRDIIAINQGVGMELLRLNRPHLFQPQTQVKK